MKRAQIIILGMLLFLVACASPETSRTRGSGAGADVGNRGQVINMHEGSTPFWKTPDLIPTKHPSLAPASQADQLSRR